MKASPSLGGPTPALEPATVDGRWHMLTPRFNRRSLRRVAATSLFAWVFALLSGVVNACLVPQHAPGDGRSVRSLPNLQADAPVHAAQVGDHTHRHADHGQDDAVNEVAKAACVKFCVEEPSALAQAKLAQPELPMLAGPAGARWPVATALVTAAAPWLRGEQPATVGPPLFIRLLRLTL